MKVANFPPFNSRFEDESSASAAPPSYSEKNSCRLSPPSPRPGNQREHDPGGPAAKDRPRIVLPRGRLSRTC